MYSVTCLQNKKGPRIRQGSPQEEEALIAHITSLAPTTQHCQQIGQLAELLIFLGHAMDARKLQSLLSEILARQKEAMERASRGVLLPQGQSGSSVMKPVAPQNIDWKWDILRVVQ
jgi:hypothetical protein